MRTRFQLAVLIAALSLAACGGGGGSAGGGGGGGGVIPPPPPGPTLAALIITIPSVGPSGRKSGPKFVDPSTTAIAASINGVPVDPSTAQSRCSVDPISGIATCSATFPAPAGSDVFDISLGTGSTVLSHGTVTWQIVAGQTTTLHLTFHGVVTSASVVADNPYPMVGGPSAVHLTLHAFDAAHNQIIGDDYDSPVSIAVSDPGGHMALATTAFRNPADIINLNYDGHLDLSANVTISTSGVTTIAPLVVIPNPYQPFGPLTHPASYVAAGSNGSVWFIECNSANPPRCQPGYIDSVGTVHEFTELPALASAALGPDGNEWYAGGALNPFIYRVTPSGVETAFQIRTIGPLEMFNAPGITAGPDGNMWFVEVDRVGKISMSGAVQEYALAPGHIAHWPPNIVAGPDNRLWFGNATENVAITTGGVFSYYPIAGAANAGVGLAVAFGADGKLYFPGYAGTHAMTTSGYETVPSATGAWDLTLGPDGNVWGFTSCTTSGQFVTGIRFITPSGGSTCYQVSPGASIVASYWGLSGSLTTTTDGNMWSPATDPIGVATSLVRFRYYP
jgi:hypothetical protein